MNLQQLSFLCWLLLSQMQLCISVGEVVHKPDPDDNRGNTPFFLQDPFDQTCLSPDGFTICDEGALWILTKRAGKKTFSLVSLLHPQTQSNCLQRKSSLFGLLKSDKVEVGPCGKSNSKLWTFEFVDQTHVKLSNEGQCLVRGKRKFKNSISVQSCNKGEFVPLVYHPTAVHENGFLLKAADGTCFDGNKFRTCNSKDYAANMWGVGVRYLWSGESARYFYNTYGDRGTCLVSRGLQVEKGLCSDVGALNWGLSNGQLTANNGKHCVARLADDRAVLARCSEAHEFIAMEIPSTHTSSGTSTDSSGRSFLNNDKSSSSGGQAKKSRTKV
jgi:hypothetical protein